MSLCREMQTGKCRTPRTSPGSNKKYALRRRAKAGKENTDSGSQYGGGVATSAGRLFPGHRLDKRTGRASRELTTSGEGRRGPMERLSRTALKRWRYEDADGAAPAARYRPGSWWVRAKTPRIAGRGTVCRCRTAPAQVRSDTRE